MRNKPHSNRFKRLRQIARALSAKPALLGAMKETVIRNGMQVERYHAFHQWGSPRRLYQDMKREGWGGSLEQLNKLVGEVAKVVHEQDQ